MSKTQTAIIVGAGPAGLTTAYELLIRTGIRPIILEKSEYMGGISRTVNFKGNRIDIGGHRFFSKSARVMKWWLAMMPLQEGITTDTAIQYHKMVTRLGNDSSPVAADPEKSDCVMLLRPRKSRIYFLRKLFEYPISLSKSTLLQLGLIRTVRIGLSYMQSAIFPLKEEKTLEQFLINRFGRELYNTFFKDYTEKVWGVPCNQISAAWGAQRIKGLSLSKTLLHAFKKVFARRDKTGHRSKGDRDFADRAVPLPEIRTGASVGRGRPPGEGYGRKNPAFAPGGWNSNGRESCHRHLRYRSCNRPLHDF